MKVVIAEKPDQASKLASPFKSKKNQGFIEVYPNDVFPKGAFFTWAIGHICELLSPEEYESSWKKWSIGTLPMIPEKFQYKVMKSKQKQYNVIRQLLHNNQVTEIIHAGDAGREGELIIRTILATSGIKKIMKRLWISSLTEKAVKDGFSSLLPEEETRNLYYEARARACADWIVGLNASRVYSLLLKEKGVSDVFSAGRVQTPTLALIVKREKEISSFKSDPFWEVLATFIIDGKVYEGKWEKDNEPRILDKNMAEKIAEFCKDKPAKVSELIKDRKEYLPPSLFNLSSLQATANKAFKFSPKKTLDVAQGLYTKGYLSYPRSDSSFITEGEAEAIPEIFSKLSKQAEYQALFPTPIASIMSNKRFVNEKKVTDHYAIIPTEQVPNVSKLSSDEQKLYDLVVRRLIAAHYEEAIFDYTTIITLVDDRATFKSKGKQQVQEGWRKVLFHEETKKDADVLLPNVEINETGNVKTVKVKEGKTQPPKRYTEGQLITLMKTAGKHLDNNELEKVLMKKEGLGTEATRAGIITMLKDRKYINVEKNQVFATEKGMLLIDAIGEKILASPEMTAKWEQRLSEIGEGKASAAEFMEQTKKLAQKIVTDAIDQSKSWNFDHINIDKIPNRKSKFTTGIEVGKCKLCNGKVVDKGSFYGCTNYKENKCTFTLSKKILTKTISQTNIQKILSEGKSNLIKGFKKGDKTFNASLVWNEKDQKIIFVFETTESKTTMN